MKNPIAQTLTLVSLSLYFSTSFASAPIEESAKGVYYLGQAERGKTQKNIGVGNLKGKPVLALTDCKKGCPMAIYQYLEAESKETGKTIYYTTGLYLIALEDGSFINVMPTTKLGDKPWTEFRFANVYSKDPAKAKQMSQQQIKDLAKQISDKLFNQAVGELKHASGTYHLAVPKAHKGESRNTYQLSIQAEGQKSVTVKPCDRCPSTEYKLLPKESGIIGTEVYRYASSDYLFDLKDGVFVSTFANASGLGKRDWNKHSRYNVYASDKNYIRQLITDKSKQSAIDKTMAKYFAEVKTSFEQEAENKRKQAVETRTLPKEGYNNADHKKQALDASKRWANSWKWQEELLNTYFISSDWASTKHPLTGITTGKVIRGIITMKHPDGRCRYQHASYRQDYDGNKYFNFQMTGVGPIYDIKCDKL